MSTPPQTHQGPIRLDKLEQACYSLVEQMFRKSPPKRAGESDPHRLSLSKGKGICLPAILQINGAFILPQSAGKK